MSDLRKEVLDALYEGFDATQVFEVLTKKGGVLDRALDNLVQRTDTSIDDMLKATIYPMLQEEILKIVAEEWGKLDPVPAPKATPIK